jgi:S-layer protein (TIGR01567 family)
MDPPEIFGIIASVLGVLLTLYGIKLSNGDKRIIAICAILFCIASGYLIYSLIPPPPNQLPEVANLVPSPGSPQKPGTIITWAAKAIDPENDDLYYKFLLNNKIILKDWSYNNICSWESSKDNLGNNLIEVFVRDGEHANDNSYDNRYGANFEIIDDCPKANSLTPDKTSPQKPGTVVTWTAEAIDPENDNISYKFVLNGFTARDWSPCNKWVWNNTTSYLGKNLIEIYVKDDVNAESSAYAEEYTIWPVNNNLEIRGEVAEKNSLWHPQNFAGFYYDIDDNLGTETLKTTITEGKELLEPNSTTYTTTAQKKDFNFADWGFYKVIGFMGSKYFAGYVNDPNINDANKILLKESTDENSLSEEQLEEILIDDDTEMTVTSGTPLKLKEGYELAIKSIDIDGNKVYLELSKEGTAVDSRVISPSKDGATMADKTYFYKTDVGDQKDLVIIAVHFKNAFRGVDQNLATVDGIWQLSDTSTEIKDDKDYGMMRIATVDPINGFIAMANKYNAIALSKNKSIPLMGNIKIKTADANECRYYIYKEITEPGTYEVRGSIATGDFEWNPQNFAGFFYDIDDKLGTETLRTTITGDNKLQEPNGVNYTTIAQKKDFAFEDWGQFNIIGFLSKEYFAGYAKDDEYSVENQLLFLKSKEVNSLSNGQLLDILIDDDTEITIASEKSLKLKEGYEIVVKAIGENNTIYLDLIKDGQVVDTQSKFPSKDNATMDDETYCYKKDVGNQADLATIAIHFKNAFSSSDARLATIDGIWQVSGTPMDVKLNSKNGKMRISNVDSTNGIIEMDNRDNTITLGRKKNIYLMGDFSLKTSDHSDGMMRYCLCREVSIQNLNFNDN